MKIKEFLKYLYNYAPLDYAEDFDNVGLIVGDENNDLSGVLISLDATEEVVDEAISANCNFILAFHPIIFSGIKSIKPNNYVNRSIIKAIKNDIAIYAIHTALDNAIYGVNAIICEKLGLSKPKILIPQQGTIKKLTTYIPTDHTANVREKLFEAGAGNIGNYSKCSFNIQGEGSFKGNNNSNPVIGEKGKLQIEKEIQVNITYPKHVENKVLKALFDNHPYEEVAFEIETLENLNQHIGLGMVATYETEITENEFLQKLKNVFKTPVIKHSALLDKNIKNVAVLGGSGAFAIKNAIHAKADVYVTSDLKYHDFFKAENKILLADIGHFESEQFTKELLYRYIIENLINFANSLPKDKIIISKINTNPVQYY